jgi:hypothetical protein
MQTLEKLYEMPFSSNKIFLMKYSFNIKIVEGGSVANY